MLGIVGRSGSGKSTITRLLQGINRDYSGFLKIDGADLREINLRHLRQSLGVVLQDNFLFRGSIRDNIIAGRPGLTLADAVQRRAPGRRRGIHRAHAERLRDLYRGRLAQSVGRPDAAARDRARADPRSAHPDPRRGDERARSGERGGGQRQSAAHRQAGARWSSSRTACRRLTECDQILVLEQGKVIDIAPHAELARALRDLSPALGAAEPPSRQPRPRSAVAPRLVSAMRRRARSMTRTHRATPSPCPGRPRRRSERPDSAGDPRIPVAVDGDRQRARSRARRAASSGSSPAWSSRLIAAMAADPGRPGGDGARHRRLAIADHPGAAAGDRDRALDRRARRPAGARPASCWRGSIRPSPRPIWRTLHGAGVEPRGRGGAPPGRGRRQALRLYRHRPELGTAGRDLSATARPSSTPRSRTTTQRIDELTATIARSQSDAAGYRERLGVAQSIEEMRKQLETSRSAASSSTLVADRHRASRWSARSRMREQTARGRQARSGRADRRARRLYPGLAREVSQKLAEATAKASDAREHLNKAKLRRKLVELRSEGDAIVQSVAKVSVGSVMQSGQQFITLVPADAPLEIEANISAATTASCMSATRWRSSSTPSPIRNTAWPRARCGSSARTASRAQDEARNPTSAVPVPQSAEPFYRSRITIDQVSAARCAGRLPRHPRHAGDRRHQGRQAHRAAISPRPGAAGRPGRHARAVMAAMVVDRLIGLASPAAALRRAVPLIEQARFAAAFPLLTRAAKAGIADAEYRVARCYLEGAGVPPSRTEGARWLERAAGHGQRRGADAARRRFACTAWAAMRSADDAPAIACLPPRRRPSRISTRPSNGRGRRPRPAPPRARRCSPMC